MPLFARLPLPLGKLDRLRSLKVRTPALALLRQTTHDGDGTGHRHATGIPLF